MNVPDSHPRKESLEVRHRLIDGFKRGLVADAGLIAHGRGEAFDYLLGEETVPEAEAAEKAAVAMLLLAENPVISVNGNVASLLPEETVDLAKALNAKIEVNLFYRTVEREKAISHELHKAGADRVFGLEKTNDIPGLSSERANVDSALWNADVVLVALEDGDRSEALKKIGKKVVAVDLNPLSRTAQVADVSVVDNIVRAFPNMIGQVGILRKKSESYLKDILKDFENSKNLDEIVSRIRGSFGN